LKVKWNKYLFEEVLPKAWVKFLRELPLEVSNIRSDDLYKFWPIIKEGVSCSIIPFCENLLKNVVENFNNEDRVFKGPSSSNAIGEISNVSANSYDMSLFQSSEFHWLSLSSGYLDEKFLNNDLIKIIGNIGFPVIPNLYPIIKVLKDSRHQNSLKNLSPATIRTYLKSNLARWQNKPREEVLKLFEYILSDKNFDELENLNMIPLADGTLGTLTRTRTINSYVYICPYDDTIHESNIFNNQLKKFIDRSIEYGLYSQLYENARSGWNLNIKILDEDAVADMIRFSLNSARNAYDEEIPISSNEKWIYKLWDYLKYRDWDLTKFEDIHLIPTNRSTLRKLNTRGKIFSCRTSKNNSINSLVSIFEKFGAVFVNSNFDNGRISKWDK
jgi:hypothetical protein